MAEVKTEAREKPLFVRNYIINVLDALPKEKGIGSPLMYRESLD